jgi:glycerol-3-phosphate dehydrogenase
VPIAKVAEAGWTAAAALPGGDFPLDGVESLVISLRTHQPFLPEPLARRLVRTYGTRATEILGSATETADLGRCFGADLYEAEVRYLTRAEWAMTATDIVWRRTKLGLRLTPDEIAALAAFLEAKSEADLHGKVEPVRASITPDRAVGR